MRISLTAIFALSLSWLFGQFPTTYTSSELYHQLEKLNTSARVLYLAAHPDDENTKLISYFANKQHVRTAYLSLTRGDGGQNLIGTEIGSGIGVLRTQELLAARKIDGGEQFFSRAVDFGYSKSADETFKKWGEENILADVVFIIRKFRPDVIITRFPPSNYAGHGHHEASAILAGDAFDLAADPNAFPEQLKAVDVWQPKRLYYNTSSWWIKDLEEQARKSDDFLRIDVGEYNSLLGESYAQIASRSRSQHQSQGFGTDFPYGTNIEYIKFVKGDKVMPGGEILDGITNDWSRYDAAEIGDIIDKAIANYDPLNPSATAATLAEAGKILNTKTKNPFFVQKQKALNTLLLQLLGLTIEYNTEKMLVVPGQEVLARIDIANPSKSPITLKKGVYGDKVVLEESILVNNQLFSQEVKLVIDDNAPFSNPYWLNEPFENIYSVDDYSLLGNPENAPSLSTDLYFEKNGYTFSVNVPVKEKTVDPAKAVIFNPTYVVPHVTFNFAENVNIAAGGDFRSVQLTVTNHGSAFAGEVQLNLPKGWEANPASIAIDLEGAGNAKIISFNVRALAGAQQGKASVIVSKSDRELRSPAMSLEMINYDHIPAQIILTPATIDLVPIDLNPGDVQLVGYIDGPGDDVAKYLSAAGYKVESISKDDLRSGNLSRFDAIVTGIRAFNTRDELAFDNENLNAYVEAGGTWLVQYNTHRGLKSEKIGPFPFVITRERVTDENAPARILNPDHAAMNYPNKLTQADFDNWVQERGLYFAADWDPKFQALISWNDGDEPPRDGGLIVAPHGKGYFVYTGISFFRQLPAGVPGAYRLLANILALSKHDQKN